MSNEDSLKSLLKPAPFLVFSAIPRLGSGGRAGDRTVWTGRRPGEDGNTRGEHGTQVAKAEKVE